MKPLTMLGAVLIVVGVIALFMGHFSFTETKPVLKAGPLEVNSQENHRSGFRPPRVSWWCWPAWVSSLADAALSSSSHLLCSDART